MTDLAALQEGFEQLSIPVGIALDGRVTYVNPACCRALAMDRQRLIALTREEAIRLLSWEKGKPAAQGPSGGQEPAADAYWVSLRNGAGEDRTFRVVRLTGARPTEKLFMLFEVEAQSVTYRLTEALAVASGQLIELRDERAVLETAADVLASQGFHVLTWMLDGDVVIHGPVRLDPELTGRFEALIGMSVHQLRLPRSQAGHLLKPFETRRAIFDQDTHQEIDRLHPPDRAPWVKALVPRRAVNAPIFAEGKPYAVISAQRDTLIPAEAGAIELFAHQVGSAIENVRHHRRAAERLGEVQALQRELVAQERLATLGEVAAVVAHEVRNPVSTILNAVRLLRQEGHRGSDEMLTMVEEEAGRLERLVTDLLHLARPFAPARQSVELAALLGKVARSAQSRRGEARIEVEGDAPAVQVDPFLLALAVENLLSNALQVTPRRGAVHLRLEAAEACVRIQVDDQGPGIPAEQAERIFEPFFTTHATGTGLGLTIVRRVVEAHQGKVQVLQNPRGGARFQIELPIGTSVPPAAVPGSAPPDGAARG